jgi:hypothetical protein
MVRRKDYGLERLIVLRMVGSGRPLSGAPESDKEGLRLDLLRRTSSWRADAVLRPMLKEYRTC